MLSDKAYEAPREITEQEQKKEVVASNE